MEYLSLIISFIVSGGLSTLVTLKLSRRAKEIETRTSKVDFADKAINFMERNNDKMMKDLAELKAEVKQLSKFKCERIDCKIRIPQI